MYFNAVIAIDESGSVHGTLPFGRPDQKDENLWPFQEFKIPWPKAHDALWGACQGWWKIARMSLLNVPVVTQ